MGSVGEHGGVDVGDSLCYRYLHRVTVNSIERS